VRDSPGAEFAEVDNRACMCPNWWEGIYLTGAFHNRAQDTVDPGRVALAILQEPFVDLFIDAGGHEHLRSSFKLSQLFVSEGRDLRIIDPGFIPGCLPLGDSGQDGFLRFTYWLPEDRFGARACLFRGPR
jgi:hypothetical protein